MKRLCRDERPEAQALRPALAGRCVGVGIRRAFCPAGFFHYHAIGVMRQMPGVWGRGPKSNPKEDLGRMVCTAHPAAIDLFDAPETN